jgi:hypothetical protein
MPAEVATMVRHRRLAAPILSLTLLLAGCRNAPPPPPAEPGPPVAWAGAAPAGLAFAYPGNWTATPRAGQQGEQFVTLAASGAERLVIGCLPTQANRSPEAFAGEIAARVKQEFPGTLTGEPDAVQVNGRPALKIGFQTQAGNRGVRYVIAGGWLVEYEARPAYADLLEPQFEAVVASLKLSPKP